MPAKLLLLLRYSLLGAVLVLGCFAIVSWLAVSWLIGPANAPVPALSGEDARRFTEVKIASTDNIELAAWYAQGQPGKAAVLLLHGVRSNRLGMLSRARWLAEQGHPLLLIDFRGHGGSAASDITMGYDEAHDALAACRFLRAKAKRVPLVIVGMSMGAAATVLGEAHRCADGLVLEALYSNLADAIGNRVLMRLGLAESNRAWANKLSYAIAWQLPLRKGFQLDELAPIERIAAIDKPILFVAGARDKRATLAQIQSMFAQAKGPKSLWILPNARHESFYDHDPTGYKTQVSDFIERVSDSRSVAGSMSK